MEDRLPRLGGESRFNATYLLIAINCAVYIAMVSSGISWSAPGSEQLLRWGADFGPRTFGGEPWRIVTSAFVHIGLLHLAVNMWCLYALGRLVERLFGPWMTVTLYVLTGAGASLLSLTWNPMRVTAGASGAIFGLAGILIPVLYFAKFDVPKENIRSLLVSVSRFAGVNLIFGMRAHVDNMAHVGGLVTGLLVAVFLAGTVFLPSEQRASKQQLIALTTAVVLALCFLPVAKANSYVHDFYLGRLALSHSQYKAASDHLEKYVAIKPADVSGHTLLATAYQGQNRMNEAAHEYETALELMPNSSLLELNLANVYLLQRKPAAALTLYRKTITKNEADFEADDYRRYGSALLQEKQSSEALTAIHKSLELDEEDPLSHELLAEVDAQLGKSEDAERERKRATELHQSK